MVLETNAELRELYCQYAAELRARFIMRLRSEENADDLVHEVFLRAQKTLARGGIEHPRTFLMRVADSVMVDNFRRLATRRETVDAFSTDETISSFPDPAPGLDRIVDSKRSVQILVKAIDKLSPRARQALVLHKFEHLSYREVADVMGISPRTVERHLSQALAQCRSELHKAGIFGDTESTRPSVVGKGET